MGSKWREQRWLEISKRIKREKEEAREIHLLPPGNNLV
jgi:hypothetical protein